jgi:predicted lipoprotein
LQAGNLLFSKFYIDLTKDESMKQKTFNIIISLIIIVCLFLVGRFGFTVVKIGEVNKVIQSGTFDPVTYVNGIWSSKLLPTFNEKSVDLSTILSEIQVDANGHVTKGMLVPVAQKYGLITAGEADEFMVKGTGKVVSLDTSSNSGLMEIQLASYSGPIKVNIYIGPIIPADDTSIRDAVGFIQFGDFQDQTQYGKVATEINNHVIKDVVSPLNIKSLQGKTITFEGAFTVRTFNLVVIDMSEINIVPIMITVEQ